MVSIIPPQDPFRGGLAQAIGNLGQAFGQRQQRQRQEQKQMGQSQALGQILQAIDPERFGGIDLQQFKRLDPQAARGFASAAFRQQQKPDTLTKSQRASQVNKIADSQRSLILNNFKGPLGEIKFTGKQGEAAKKALQQLENTRQKKIKAIFGDDVPDEFQEEFDAANKFFSGGFDEIPAPEQNADSKPGFFSRLFGGGKKQTSSKKLTDKDISRISEEVKRQNPNATPQQLQDIASKKARDEGFEF